MIRGTIWVQGVEIPYELTFKRVKNINLRIKSQKLVCISAPKWVGKQAALKFLQSHGSWVLEHWRKMEQHDQLVNQPHPVLWEESVFGEILEELYPQFQRWVPRLPRLTIRTMKTRWGSCNPSRCHITLNRMLLCAPKECIRYVMVHELVHFIHLNHSADFYKAMDYFLPEHQMLKRQLKDQHLL